MHEKVNYLFLMIILYFKIKDFYFFMLTRSPEAHLSEGEWD